jgi:hypothetical protein
MRIIILSVLLLVTLSGFTMASLTFEEVDIDGDGLVSADEAASVEALNFNVADSDNDGALSVDEYDIAVENLSKPTSAQSPAEATPLAQAFPAVVPAPPVLPKPPATPSKP